MDTSGIKKFDFSQHEGLRIWKNNLDDYPGHPTIHQAHVSAGWPLGDMIYFRDPVSYEDIKVNILVDKQDLSILAKLIPNVKKLRMSFCEPSRKRDLRGLASLLKENGGKLEELHIFSEAYDTTVPRVKGIDSLIGKIPVFMFFGQDITLYKPRTIKNPKFSHIISIAVTNSVLFYRMSEYHTNKELLYKITNLGSDDSFSDITIQIISNEIIFLLAGYMDYRTNGHPVDLKVIPLNLDQLLSLIYQNFTRKERKAFGNNYPRTMQELNIIDDDTIDELSVDPTNNKNNFDDDSNENSEDKDRDGENEKENNSENEEENNSENEEENNSENEEENEDDSVVIASHLIFYGSPNAQ